MEDAREEVAAQLVGAQKVIRRGVEKPVARVDPGGIPLGDEVGEDGPEDHQKDKGETEDAQRLAQQPPERAHEFRRGPGGGVRSCF